MRRGIIFITSRGKIHTEDVSLSKIISGIIWLLTSFSCRCTPMNQRRDATWAQLPTIRAPQLTLALPILDRNFLVFSIVLYPKIIHFRRNMPWLYFTLNDVRRCLTNIYFVSPSLHWSVRASTTVTGRPISAAIFRAGKKKTTNRTQIRFTKFIENYTLFTQSFDWFPALGRLRVSPPSLGTYGETIHNDKFKPNWFTVHLIAVLHIHYTWQT